MRKRLCRLLLAGVACLTAAGTVLGNNTVTVTSQDGAAPEACPRPLPGAVATEPETVYSSHGVLKVALTFRSSLDEYGQRRYCYTTPNNAQAPTLHVLPGDEVILTLVNQVRLPMPQIEPIIDTAMQMPASSNLDCAGGRMDRGATNLHFHGLGVPPHCHGDDVLTTLVRPSQLFEYRFAIPPDEPPGLYWYHPHAHGLSEEQVQGGASGALIVDGIAQTVPSVRGLRERVLVLRDQPLIDSGRPRDPLVPAWDISLNAVPILYPAYAPAVLFARPLVRELWRVLNASADTHFDLQVLQNGAAEKLDLIALDGAPLAHKSTVDHVVLSPGARAEFVLTTPGDKARASLVTRAFDTGPVGDANPSRPIANLLSDEGVPNIAERSPRIDPPAPPRSQGVTKKRPVRRRLFYFSQAVLYPNDLKSPTSFFLTEDGHKPAAFDMRATPGIVVPRGTVEDWTIENRSGETHDFHIHQIHFQVLERNGVKLLPPEVRDTVPVDYWDGASARYPSVTLRMDFSSPACQGTVLFHCHILEHEDAGMMSSIQIVSSARGRRDLQEHSR